MKHVAALLLLTAAVEVSLAVTWDYLLTVEETCNIDAPGLCFQTLFWLVDSGASWQERAAPALPQRPPALRQPLATVRRLGHEL